MTLDRAVRAFQKLLKLYWSEVCLVAAADTTGSLVPDWQQANWEQVVERVFPAQAKIVLAVYGDGADCYPTSSRVYDKDALTTHHVVCRSESNTVRDLLLDRDIDIPAAGAMFDRFVTMRDGWYHEGPPFDCVLLSVDDREVVVRADCVLFDVVPTEVGT